VRSAQKHGIILGKKWLAENQALPNYQVPWPEEMIISSTKNQDTELPSKKLDYKWAGPFQALA